MRTKLRDVRQNTLLSLATASVGLERMRMPMMLPLLLLSGLSLQPRATPSPDSKARAATSHEAGPSLPAGLPPLGG
jgi:hypothetical protein